MNKEAIKGAGRGLQAVGRMIGDMVPIPDPLKAILGAPAAALGNQLGVTEWIDKLLSPGYTPGSVTADKDIQFAGTAGEMFGAGLPFGSASVGAPTVIAGGEYFAGDKGKELAALGLLSWAGLKAGADKYLHNTFTGGLPEKRT